MKHRVLIFVLFLLCFCSVYSLHGQEPSSTIQVIFLSGLGSEDADYTREMKAMNDSFRKLYPDFQVSIQWIPWKAGSNFWEYVQVRDNTREVSRSLVDKIAALTLEERQNLVLCGHSLGGKAVIQILADLKQKELQIRQAVLLGAAISVSDPIILDTVGTTMYPILNFIIEEDGILKTFFPLMENQSFALGSGLGIDCHILDIHTSLGKFPAVQYHALYRYSKQLNSQAEWMSRLCR